MQSTRVMYRGVEAWVTIEDSDALPESYVTISLWHRPRTDGETVPAFTADVRARRNENADRCPICGGLNPGDITHTRC